MLHHHLGLSLGSYLVQVQSCPSLLLGKMPPEGPEEMGQKGGPRTLRGCTLSEARTWAMLPCDNRQWSGEIKVGHRQAHGARALVVSQCDDDDEFPCVCVVLLAVAECTMGRGTSLEAHGGMVYIHEDG